MRAKAANVAARAAVGATDMLSKWTMMAAQGLAKRQGGDTGDFMKEEVLQITPWQ
jgi:hypothetical protein